MDNKIKAIINKDNDYSMNDEVYLEFIYTNESEKLIVKNLVEKEILPILGITSFIATYGYGVVIPIYERNNELTYSKTDVIRSLVIPIFLIDATIKKLINSNIIITFGSLVITDKYSNKESINIYKLLQNENKTLSKKIKPMSK